MSKYKSFLASHLITPRGRQGSAAAQAPKFPVAVGLPVLVPDSPSPPVPCFGIFRMVELAESLFLHYVTIIL